MLVNFFLFEDYHGKKNVGSSRLRGHQLIKYWPEASLYRYGLNPDVLIFQKVYCTADYKFPSHFQNIKILDVVDPDWLDLVAMKETIEVIDAVVCSTEPLAEFIKQLTDKPVVVIPDRHDLENVPKLKEHEGDGKKLVWFGYRHNSDCLKGFIRAYADSDYTLTIISNDNPILERGDERWKGRIKYVPFEEQTLYHYLQESDIALLPDNNRPQDRFKSNNRTVIAHLAGLPVAKTPEDLERFNDPVERNKEAQEKFKWAVDNYDVRKSVEQYKELIRAITNN